MADLPLQYFPVVTLVLCILLLVPLISFFRRHRDRMFGGERMRGDLILVGYMCVSILSLAFSLKVLLGG